MPPLMCAPIHFICIFYENSILRGHPSPQEWNRKILTMEIVRAHRPLSNATINCPIASKMAKIGCTGCRFARSLYYYLTYEPSSEDHRSRQDQETQRYSIDLFKRYLLASTHFWQQAKNCSGTLEGFRVPYIQYRDPLSGTHPTLRNGLEKF